MAMAGKEMGRDVALLGLIEIMMLLRSALYCMREIAESQDRQISGYVTPYHCGVKSSLLSLLSNWKNTL
jgi:hypothetical protein